MAENPRVSQIGIEVSLEFHGQPRISQIGVEVSLEPLPAAKKTTFLALVRESSVVP